MRPEGLPVGGLLLNSVWIAAEVEERDGDIEERWGDDAIIEVDHVDGGFVHEKVAVVEIVVNGLRRV